MLEQKGIASTRPEISGLRLWVWVDLGCCKNFFGREQYAVYRVDDLAIQGGWIANLHAAVREFVESLLKLRIKFHMLLDSIERVLLPLVRGMHRGWCNRCAIIKLCRKLCRRRGKDSRWIRVWPETASASSFRQAS